MAHTQQREDENKEDRRQDPMSGRKVYDDLIASLPSDDSWWGYTLRRYRHFWYPEPPPPCLALHQRHLRGETVGHRLPSKVQHHMAQIHRLLHPQPPPPPPLVPPPPSPCLQPPPMCPLLTIILRLLDSPARRRPRLSPLSSTRSAAPFLLRVAGLRPRVRLQDCVSCQGPEGHSGFPVPLLWVFTNGVDKKWLSFGHAFELFCSGVSFYGPVWENQLEYWRESQEQPDRVMFIKYEDMMADTANHVKKLAEFMGCRFEEEEDEEAGVIEEIVRLCSFDSLRNATMNREGGCVVDQKGEVRIHNSACFRKGKVMDWRNHMCGEMAMRLDGIAVEKFAGSGLGFPSGSG